MVLGQRLKPADQFTSLYRAQLTARIMNTIPIGNGVRPYTSDTDPESGIYVPSWAGTPAPPGETIVQKQYYFRLVNGCNEMNADVCWDLILHSPNWDLILQEQAALCIESSGNSAL